MLEYVCRVCVLPACVPVQHEGSVVVGQGIFLGCGERFWAPAEMQGEIGRCWVGVKVAWRGVVRCPGTS